MHPPNPNIYPSRAFSIIVLSLPISLSALPGPNQSIDRYISRMRKPCCDKQDTNKGAWSKQEDEKLIDYIRKHGEGCWRTLPQAAGLLRCGKSCRLRWINYLRPDLKRGNFAEDEEDLIIKLHALLGNRWSLIAGRLPGRTDNEVKNYWNSHLSRKLIKMGFDPNNHRPGQNDNVVPRPQTCTPSNSSAGLNLASARAPLKPISRISNENNSDNSNTNNNDQKSDARSSVEDEQEQQLSHGHDDELPDLNLDLAISINVSSPSKSVAECSRRRGCGCDVDGESNLPTEIHEVASCRSPTLLLFQ